MTSAEDLKQLQYAVQKLPSNAVKDLLSAGSCGPCILRLVGLYDHTLPHPSLPTRVVTEMLREVKGCHDDTDSSVEHEGLKCQLPSHEFEPKSQVCKICIGVLDFVYCDEKGTLLKKDSASEFAKTIAEAVKQEYCQIDGFSLEVSVPPLILENEQAARSYLMRKYGYELALCGNSSSDCFSTKDALKLSLTDTLENLLGVKSNCSSVRIRLTYANTKESTTSLAVDLIKECKKRKIDNDHNPHSLSGSETSVPDSLADNGGELNGVASYVSKELGNELWRQLNKVLQPCSLTVLLSRCPIYLGGRYLKYSRNVSQTRWIIEDERMGEASVEEIIGGNILPLFQGDSYKFHAAGREDIDVRMLGTGRPFLVEIQNARQVPSDELINHIQTKINSMESKYVKIKNLKVLGNEGWDLMREGEAEKQKQYAALVWISRPLNDDALHTLSELKDMQIMQKTPVRVLHRRSPLEREKLVYWMKVERISGSSHHFLLHLCTQAGTYIKEFVHGDLGRTHPNIGSILGCRAEILQLDVTDVKMDCF